MAILDLTTIKVLASEDNLGWGCHEPNVWSVALVHTTWTKLVHSVSWVKMCLVAAT